MSDQYKDQKEKLLEIMREATQQDKNLREKFQMGDKFRFIRDRLNNLLSQVEDHLTTLHEETNRGAGELAPDEIVVYVYLYNAQGVALQSWLKMLTPGVFYEYSVNRPLYADKNQVEAFIKRRSNPAQHGYLAVAIKKDHLLSLNPNEVTKDALDQPLIKVKEGSLRFERLISFTHANHDYQLNEDGELIKKNLS